jgi:suppressor for copper-sensitivity B
MAALTTLFAASLWGVLPIGMPGVAAAAAGVRPRHPMLDAFAAGAFATLMATSCSAPFVGTAVGFALARGPAEIMLIFAVLGLGMAAPLLAVAAAPGLVRFLPRPGAWMVWLRLVLGLALAGTAAWLLWVLAQVAGLGAATIAGIALVALVAALALQDRYEGAWRRAAQGAAMALVIISVLVPGLAVPPPSQRASNEGQAIQWQSFDTARIRREVAAGKLVFVDVTAAWCLTCKVNEAAVLDRDPVASRLGTPRVIAMRADWTRPELQITSYLQSFGRYGVPLNVVYGPGRPDGEALPELLSSSAVLAVMERAMAAPKTLTER